MTTFVGYGRVPGQRQAEIMRSLGNPAPATIEGLNIEALEAFLQSAKAANPRIADCKPGKLTA